MGGTQESSPPSKPIAGRMAGAYRLIEPIGSGGMGALWAAEDPVTGERAAIKLVLAKSARRDPTALARFEREAKVLSMIDHPHVAKLMSQGELDDGMPYIAMELLAGESLVERLEGMQDPMPFGHVTELVTQLGAALEHIHGLGIIHRDLKAEHILLVGAREGMDTKIIDFGLAKAPGITSTVQVQLTTPGTKLGSVEYMSPEQVMDSAAVDEHADLWAFAVMAYMALTQEFPFKGESLRDLLEAINKAEFTSPSRLNPTVPATVDAFFTRAFDLDMAERFPSARSMVDAWYEATGLQHQTPTSNKRTLVILIAMVVAIVIALAIYLVEV